MLAPPFKAADRLITPDWFPTDEELAQFLGGGVGFQNYRPKLFRMLGSILPKNGQLRILDVGAGDGAMAEFFFRFRPNTQCLGLETMLRHVPNGSVEIKEYSGKSLPFEDKTFDCVLFSNVLHHTTSACDLLKDAARVTCGSVVVKDHVCSSRLDWLRLTALDYSGNARFGVACPALYLSCARWDEMFRASGLIVRQVYKCNLREGLVALAFPNRLEVIFDLVPVR